MPAYSFTLTVRVGCEINFVSFLDLTPQFSKNITLSSDGNILGFIVMLDINSHGTSGKITNMSVTGCYFIAAAQKLLDSLNLGR